MLRLVMQDVPVVTVAKGGGAGAGGSTTSNVSLRVTDRQAAELAFATDNGKVWLALRPPTGAERVRPGLVTIETMLLGVPPVTILRAIRGR
jgi:Flp pilus assembly protein CpaB